MKRCALLPLMLAALFVGLPARSAEPTKQQCVAANDAAQDLRQSGKLRQAREKLVLCSAASCPAIVRDDCVQRLTEVDAAMPSIIFEAKDAAGNDLAAVTVTMDGEPFADKLDGAQRPVDPGEHTFVFEVVGLAKVEKKFVVVEGVKGRRERIVLAAAAPTTSPPPVIASPSPAETTRSVGPPPLAWAAFGVGGAGLVLGITAGLVAGGKHATLQGECNNTAGTCAPQYAGDLDAFNTWRTVSTIGYVVGALGVAGGAALWFLVPKAPSTTARVWVGPASAGVAGAF
jgi:hypothetical protein